MSAGGREHPEGAGDGSASAALDAYLDGQLAGPERTAFEARLAEDPALAGDLELQWRMDRSLRGVFVIPPFAGVPTNGHPTPLPNGEAAGGAAGSRAAAAAAAGVILSAAAAAAASNGARRWTHYDITLGALMAVIAGSVFMLAYTALANRRVSFDQVYRDVVASPPASGTAGGFEAACQTSLGRALKPMKPAPAGVQVLGVSEAAVLSRKTIVLRARVDGQDVLLFADRPEAEADNTGRLGGGCHLNLFRRVAGGVVLYELTPLDQPRLLDQYADPPPDACDSGENLSMEE